MKHVEAKFTEHPPGHSWFSVYRSCSQANNHLSTEDTIKPVANFREMKGNYSRAQLEDKVILTAWSLEWYFNTICAMKAPHNAELHLFVYRTILTAGLQTAGGIFAYICGRLWFNVEDKMQIIFKHKSEKMSSGLHHLLFKFTNFTTCICFYTFFRLPEFITYSRVPYFLHFLSWTQKT